MNGDGFVRREFSSTGQVDNAIAKLRRRLDDVDELAAGAPCVDGPGVDPSIMNPKKVVPFDGQKRRNTQSGIRETILEVFGETSPEFKEHQYHEIWHGREHVDMSRGECQVGFLRGIPHTREMLQGLVRRLEEKKIDMPSGVSESRSRAAGELRVFIIHGHDEAKRRELEHFTFGCVCVLGR